MVEIEFDLEKIKSDKILIGDVIWHKKSGRIVVGHCGDLANLTLLSKLAKNGSVLSLSSHANFDLINLLTKEFLKLKNAESERERVRSRKIILQEFADVFVNATKKGSFIDWWIVCYRSFNNLPLGIEDYVSSNSLDLYRRAIGLGTFSVLFALAYGYMNYKFLQDIYNGMFVCDLEVLDPASFKKYYFDKLEESRTSTIVSTLSEYFKENKLQIKEFLKKCEIENEEVYHLIKYHHERPESSQGPFGISENESHDLTYGRYDGIHQCNCTQRNRRV